MEQPRVKKLPKSNTSIKEVNLCSIVAKDRFERLTLNEIYTSLLVVGIQHKRCEAYAKSLLKACFDNKVALARMSHRTVSSICKIPPMHISDAYKISGGMKTVLYHNPETYSGTLFTCCM